MPKAPPGWIARALTRQARWWPLSVAAIAFALLDGALIAGLDWGRIYWDSNRSAVATVATLTLGAFATALAPLPFAPGRLPRAGRAGWWGLLTLIVAACLLLAHVALAGFLHSADEFAYLFEAHTLAAGRLWNPPPPLGIAESAQYVWVAGGKWVAQYPPGWPAMLALFEIAAPTDRLANALLLALTTLGVAELVQGRAGRQAGFAAALLFGLSPFALFNGASLYSHMMAAALAVAAMLASREACRRGSLGIALAAGAAIGLLGITRSVTAAVVIPLVAIDQLRRPGWFARLVAVGIGGVPFVATLLGYQYLVTGDPLKPVYWLGGRNVDHLYFDLPSIRLGVRHAVLNMGEIGLYAAPLALPLWLVAMVALARRRNLRAMDFVFPAGVAVFCFYPLHPGARFGPRYYLDFWPLAIVTIGAAVPAIAPVWRRWYRQAILFSAVYAAVLTVALGFEWARVTRDRFDVYRVIAAARLHDALVCMKTPSGTLMKIGNAGFARNGIDADGPVLYVNCRKTNPAAMRAAYPTRAIWGYYRDPGATTGRLALIAPALRR